MLKFPATGTWTGDIPEFYGNFPEKPTHDRDRDREQEEDDGKCLRHKASPAAVDKHVGPATSHDNEECVRRAQPKREVNVRI